MSPPIVAEIAGKCLTAWFRCQVLMATFQDVTSYAGRRSSATPVTTYFLTRNLRRHFRRAGLEHICHLCGSAGDECNALPARPRSGAFLGECGIPVSRLVRDLLAEGREAAKALGSVNPWIAAVGQEPTSVNGSFRVGN